jgi:hypothetical protein
MESPDGEFLYYTRGSGRHGPLPPAVTRRNRTGARREILSPKFVTPPSDGALALSPDGQYLLYVQTDDAGSNINIMEGLP